MSRPLFQLDQRLALCASLVRTGVKLADIGTDHAYLPIWLAKQGKIVSAVAADVREGPLKIAQENIQKYSAFQVSVRLSDGLRNIREEEADDIVIAGMGGELISRIIAETDWLKKKEKRLILQPMTSVGELRVALSDLGFTVLEEHAVWCGHHIYTAMQVSYYPDRSAKGELFPYIGSLRLSESASRDYFRQQIKILEKRSAGLRLGGKREEAENLSQICKKLCEMLGEEKL